MSNHMANKVKRLALMNENITASALIGGIRPTKNHTQHILMKSTIVMSPKMQPRV